MNSQDQLASEGELLCGALGSGDELVLLPLDCQMESALEAARAKNFVYWDALEIEARAMRFTPETWVREAAESKLAARRLPFVSTAKCIARGR